MNNKSQAIFIINYLLLIIGIASCSVSKQINKQAKQTLFTDSAVNSGHTGISIYDPAADKYWYTHNATQYFIPASNVKLLTLYAGMKYLGDSLVGLKYFDKSYPFMYPTGDPTFLHPDFKNQPVSDFLKKQKGLYINKEGWQEKALGYGWAWDDYNGSYMVERSPMPVYGNVTKFSIQYITKKFPNAYVKWSVTPSMFQNQIDSAFSAFRLHWSDTSTSLKGFFQRELAKNIFKYNTSGSRFTTQEIPFKTDGINTTSEILKHEFGVQLMKEEVNSGALILPSRGQNPPKLVSIKTQPSDSLFKPMMHRSDNFFAEQTLLMASNEFLGYMSDEKMIDTILRTSLKDLPQRPKWVDGSGLSRYNLATPQSIIFLLNKMKNEFGMERLKEILPTGGEGTISSYYRSIAGNIYAKTGTLSNNCALSGFLITKKGKLLIFSVLNNNYITGATPVRRAVEKFLLAIQANY